MDLVSLKIDGQHLWTWGLLRCRILRGMTGGPWFVVGHSWLFVCRWAPGHPLLARLRLLPHCAESGSHAQVAGSAPLWEERRSPWTLGIPP